MIAGSMRQECVGSTHVPLQLKQTPPLATIEMIAKDEINQYQPVYMVMQDGQAQVADLRVGAAPNGGVNVNFGIAAFPAKAGESVSVYVNGFFNINALYLTGSAIENATDDEKIKTLNACSPDTNMFFGVAPTNTVQSA